MFLLLAPAIGIKRVFEVVRVRWIDPKRSAFYVLQRSNIHFGGKKITHRHQTPDSIDQFSRLHLFNPID